VSNSFGQLIDCANKQHTYIHTYGLEFALTHAFPRSGPALSATWKPALGLEAADVVGGGDLQLGFGRIVVSGVEAPNVFVRTV
jgi:hypothetical protein